MSALDRQPCGAYALSVLDRQITDLLVEACPDAIAIYLFGSEARGDQTMESDIDIALLAPRPLDPVARFNLQERVARLLHRDVDLVDLRSASTVMRVTVLADARVVFEGDRYQRELFEATALSMYARLHEERKAILEQVAKDGRVYG